MNGFLLDVNVLLALAWVDHVHHRAAHVWFTNNRSVGWATCTVTQLGFVRISINPSFSVVPANASAVWEVLRRIAALDGHRFFTEPANGLADQANRSLADANFALATAHRMISDAFLVLVATKSNGKLATFDESLKRTFPTQVDLIATTIPASP